jgi:hypothetical protein
LIIVIILGEEYKLWISSLCSFLQPPVTSSLFGPNIHVRVHMFKKPSRRFEFIIRPSSYDTTLMGWDTDSVVKEATNRQTFYLTENTLSSITKTSWFRINTCLFSDPCVIYCTVLTVLVGFTDYTTRLVTLFCYRLH